MEKKIRVAIADDHPMVVDGLKNYFSSGSNIEVVVAINKVVEVPSIILKYNPDILLMDYHFNNEALTGIDMCFKIKKEFPLTKVIIISSFSDVSLIKRFIEVGASGYLLKTATREEFIEAIQNVYLGLEAFGKDARELLIKDKLQHDTTSSIRFTKTEKEVLRLIIEGCSTEEIAKKLFREKTTIDSHRKSILSKFQLMDKDNPNPSKNILFYVTKFNIANRIDTL